MPFSALNRSQFLIEASKTAKALFAWALDFATLGERSFRLSFSSKRRLNRKANETLNDGPRNGSVAAQSGQLRPDREFRQLVPQRVPQRSHSQQHRHFCRPRKHQADALIPAILSDPTAIAAKSRSVRRRLPRWPPFLLEQLEPN